jgi:predicted transcriptional regulator of viral defense system
MSPRPLNLTDAIEGELRRAGEPLITEYEFFRLGQRIFSTRIWEGRVVQTRMTDWDPKRANGAASRLNKRNILAHDPDLGYRAWRVLTSSRAAAAEEVACIADPFCYVAFLSAMQRYGLTERTPVALHLTTPSREVWAERRRRKEADDFPDGSFNHPSLMRLQPTGYLRGRPVTFHESNHPDNPLQLRGERTRVSTIGRTFVDMLEEPSLCGGMHHILDIWDEHASAWLDDIVAAVDQSPVRLAKMRAGYILSERLGLNHPTLDRWAGLAQRGGSQKLDPEQPYGAQYSERWMISLNV